ncbi:hypothetical protein HanRHA438_Chr11g0527221 [Helianthus annuus]|nr:hypothetical protein HanRHA438_Chr11g0527221 [Helianthus annuus]KAJ0877140.1 hypothetical protein HanPSC8_Chr11g0496681 [Helianthus annuus]
MTIRGGLLVPVIATPLQVEVNRHHPGPKVEILLDQSKDILIRDLSGFVRVDKHRQRFGHTNSVRNLNNAPACEPRSHYALGRLPNNISPAPIHFRRVLPGERTATVSSPSAVRVDDNLPSGETRVTVGTTDHKPARRVQVEDSVFIKILRRDHGLDHVLFEISRDLVVSHGLVMLCRDENRVDPDWYHSTVVVSVLNRHLGLSIGSEPWASLVLSNLG